MQVCRSAESTALKGMKINTQERSHGTRLFYACARPFVVYFVCFGVCVVGKDLSNLNWCSIANES